MLPGAADPSGLQPKLVFFNTTTMPGKQFILISLHY
jgi:hypothetical protein